MKKILRLLAGAAVGAVVSTGFTSCYYDPNYSSTSVGGSYSSGYGQGYGYGGSGFSTSVLVSTGNPQWGYDPNCYSYYDYHRRCYYDPYLNGYYPIGYRPPVVYGVPHPYGWRAGGGYIRPPVYVQNVTVKNYNNRAVAYQNTNYGWAKQVRQQPVSQGRVTSTRSNSGSSYNNNTNSRPNTGTRPSGNSSQNNSGRYPQATRENTRPSANEQKGKLPARYNTPVKESNQRAQQAPKNGKTHQQAQHPESTRQDNRNGKAETRAEENRKRSNNRF